MKTDRTICVACGTRIVLSREFVENNREALDAGEEHWLTCGKCNRVIAGCCRDDAFETTRIVGRQERLVVGLGVRVLGLVGVLGVGMFGWCGYGAIRDGNWLMGIGSIILVFVFFFLALFLFADPSGCRAEADTSVDGTAVDEKTLADG